MQQKNPKGRPTKGPKARRTCSISMDHLTWDLLERIIDQTPRANRGTIIEGLVWRRGVELGLATGSKLAAAQKIGLFPREGA